MYDHTADNRADPVPCLQHFTRILFRKTSDTLRSLSERARYFVKNSQKGDQRRYNPFNYEMFPVVYFSIPTIDGRQRQSGGMV